LGFPTFAFKGKGRMNPYKKLQKYDYRKPVNVVKLSKHRSSLAMWFKVLEVAHFLSRGCSSSIFKANKAQLWELLALFWNFGSNAANTTSL